MQTQVRDLEDACSKQVSITIDAEAVEKQFRQSFAELRNTISLPGFRRGKVPISMLQKRFGDEVGEDVKRDLVMEGLQNAVKDNGLDLVADPQFNFEGMTLTRGEEFTFEIDIEVRPEFDLPSYTKIKATRTVDAINDDNVDNVIEDLRKQRAFLSPVEDGTIEKEDNVVGRLEVRSGDEVVLEREQDGCIAGEAEQIAQIPFEGFGDLVLGKKVGDELRTSSTVPEDYPVQDMQGRDVDLHFTINEIKRVEIPEVDEDFAKGFGFDDLKDLREKIDTDLREHAVERADRNVEEAIIDDILGRVDFPVPPTVLSRTVGERLQHEAMQALYAGQMKGDDMQSWVADRKPELEKDAERSIRAWYLIQKIAKKEKIFATESDLEAKINEIARREGQTPTQVREQLREKDGIEELRAGALEEKVRKFLRDKAEIKEETAASDAAAE